MHLSDINKWWWHFELFLSEDFTGFKYWRRLTGAATSSVSSEVLVCDTGLPLTLKRHTEVILPLVDAGREEQREKRLFSSSELAFIRAGRQTIRSWLLATCHLIVVNGYHRSLPDSVRWSIFKLITFIDSITINCTSLVVTGIPEPVATDVSGQHLLNFIHDQCKGGVSSAAFGTFLECHSL